MAGTQLRATKVSRHLLIFAPVAAAMATPQAQAQSAPGDPTPLLPSKHRLSHRPVAVTPQMAAAQRILDGQIQSLGVAFNGDIGIAVRDLQTGWTSLYDGTTYFPQQSVSKFWVTLTALDKADRGELDLQKPVTMHREDLTLFNQPIARLIKADGGYTTTLSELMRRAMQHSDNTCNDFVLWKTGGPEAVRDFLADKGISGIRFGPGERLLQSQIAGMTWKQSYSIGNAFSAARAEVPAETRKAAFDRYIANPIDGATPLGIVDALEKLKKGELLSAASTQRLLDIMSNTRTGPQRLKGGLAPGWKLAHKTGTGQNYGGATAGYNDIGILTAPDGRSYAVAVMIRRTYAPIPERMAVMQATVRSVISYQQNLQGYNIAGSGGAQGNSGTH